MDNLNSILSNKDFDIPPEVRAIKEYVRRCYDADVHVSLQHNNIVITGSSAALIGTLRMNMPKLQKAAETEKRLVFRIS